MEIILVLEILLLTAAFAVLNRALRQRVADAARWEASVAAEMNRSARAVTPLKRVAPDDVTATARRDYSAVIPAKAGIQ